MKLGWKDGKKEIRNEGRKEEVGVQGGKERGNEEGKKGETYNTGCLKKVKEEEGKE